LHGYPHQPMADVNRISRLGFVNAYLVRENDGLTVIDTMIGGSAGKIIAGAEAIGAPIVRILLTHAHADHIGSLDALKERLPEADVIISARDARLLAKDMSPDAQRFMAKRAGSHTIAINSSHVAYISHPAKVTKSILRAARKVASA